MSEILTAGQNPPVQTPEDVLDLYKCVNTSPYVKERVSRIGIEVEHNYYRTDGLSALDQATNAEIIKKAGQEGVPVHEEPSASTLEVISDPYTRDEFDTLAAQIESRFRGLLKTVEAEGIFPSPFAHLPHLKPEDHHQLDNPRYRAFWIPPRDDMVDAYHSFVDPSIQVSLSFDSDEQMMRVMRLCLALEPLMILTTDATAPVFEGESADFCPRMEILKRRGRNGGIPDFYYTARNGKDFVRAHIDYIFHNKHVFAYFNHDGELMQHPTGEWLNYLDIAERGLGPGDLLNYRQAQSENWRRSANLAEIRDQDGTLYCHRAEIASLFCTGLQHQRMSALLMGYLIGYDENFYEKTKARLFDVGINLEALDESKAVLEQNYEAAHQRGNEYHGLAFGTKTVKDFVLPFADLIESCADSHGLADHAKPLLHILRSGRPDWLVYREHLPTLEIIKDYMTRLPELVKEEPALLDAGSCADFVVPEVTRKLAA